MLCALAFALCGCEKQAGMSVDDHGFSASTKLTADLNAAVEKELPLDDQQNFEDARRGLIASDNNLKVVNPNIGTLWDQTAQVRARPHRHRPGKRTGHGVDRHPGSHGNHQLTSVVPPSTGRICPVIKAPALLASMTATPAISSALPHRCRGMAAHSAS